MINIFKWVFNHNTDWRLLSRKQHAIGIFLTFTILLVTCNSLVAMPKGLVKGILVDKEGNPFPKKVDVFLATILNDATGEMTLNTSWQSPLDESGAFLIKNVPPGKYALLFFLKNTGEFYFIYLSKDERFTFKISPDRGIDLGKIDASLGRRLQ